MRSRLFAPLVLAALERRGITRADLSRRLGGAHSYVYHVLAGRYPPPASESVLRAWAAAAGMDARETERAVLAGMLDRAPELLRATFIKRTRWR